MKTEEFNDNFKIDFSSIKLPAVKLDFEKHNNALLMQTNSN